MNELAVLGAGSWGTALAIALASRFTRVRIWARDEARSIDIERHRENRRYLPGFHFPANIIVSADLDAVISGSQVILSAVPSAHLRRTITAVRCFGNGAKIVSATKGLEPGTLLRMSQVITQSLGRESPQVAVLSGPTFAKEVASGEPAAVVIASQNKGFATEIQKAFSTPAFRLYTSLDVIGVEVGAALKNVVAIGAGICTGLGLGSNSVAALVTRGLAEITRLAVAMGGEARTLSGLAGLGDLVLTTTGDLSRNRYVGTQIGKGHQLGAILAGMSMVAEGVTTCQAAVQLGKEKQVDLPIINQMHEILNRGKNPREAIQELMERPLTTE